MATAAGATPSSAVRLFAGFAAVYLFVAIGYAAPSIYQAASSATPSHLPLVGAALLSFATAMALASRLGSLAALILLLVASFSAQIAWAIWIDAQPFGTFGVLWDSARRMAAEPSLEFLFASPSPMAVALYASIIKAFGAELDAARIVAAGLWTVQTALVWKIARQLREVKGGALAAAAAVGLTPAAVVYGALPSAEAVFAPLVLAGVYLILSHRNRGLFLSALLAGVFLGLAFLTKPTAVAYAAPILLVLATALLAARSLTGAIGLFGGLAALLIGVAVLIAPVLQLQAERQVSPVAKLAPSLGFDLMFGANRASGGGYAVSDLEQIGFSGGAGGDAAFDKAERAARALAFERIAEDPAGFAVFAATEKMRRLWSNERALLNWTVDAPSPRRAEIAEMDLKDRAGAIIDGAYLAVLALAALGATALAFRGAVLDPSRWMILLGAFALLAVSHAVLVADARGHLVFMPLLALFGGYALTPGRRAASAAAEAQPDASDATASVMVDITPEQKLASVLSQMSRPPRPEDGPRDGGAASSGPARSAPMERGAPRSGGRPIPMAPRPSQRRDDATKRKPTAVSAPR